MWNDAIIAVLGVLSLPLGKFIQTKTKGEVRWFFNKVKINKWKKYLPIDGFFVGLLLFFAFPVGFVYGVLTGTALSHFKLSQRAWWIAIMLLLLGFFLAFLLRMF